VTKGDRRARLQCVEARKDVFERLDAEGPGEEYRDPKSDRGKGCHYGWGSEPEADGASKPRHNFSAALRSVIAKPPPSARPLAGREMWVRFWRSSSRFVELRRSTVNPRQKTWARVTPC